LRRRSAFLLILPAAAVACGSSTSAVAPQGPIGSVSTTAATPSATNAQEVDLSEWKVAVPTTFKAGQVSFNVVNTGAIQHELLVFKSDLDPSQYPQDSNGIVEDGAGITKVSDGDNLDAGKSQSRTVDLSQPGKYLFVCNIPGHFKQGMFTVVIVTS